MKTFRTLDLAVDFYQMVKTLEVPNHLKDQMLRAASSIPLNLAEGNAKFSYRDKSRVYQIAYGSFRECQVIFRLAELKDNQLEAKVKHLGASLYRLIEGTQKKVPDPKI